MYISTDTCLQNELQVQTMSTYNNKTFSEYLTIYTNKDIGAFTCASKTCSTMPDLVQDIIIDYTKSMYVTQQHRKNLAQLARMCAGQVKEKVLRDLRKAREDFYYAQIWYEKAVQGTEKMLYENKGNAPDAVIEAAMDTRQQLEDDWYQRYLYALNNYNTVVEEKTEVLSMLPCAWYHLEWHHRHLKNNNSIEERAQERLSIAQDWITQREIDDGLWDPEYPDDKAEALSQQPQPHDPTYPVDHEPDEPAIGFGCWGCAENQPNQQAHMGLGGCLYTPSLESEEEYEAEEYNPQHASWAYRYED